MERTSVRSEGKGLCSLTASPNLYKTDGILRARKCCIPEYTSLHTITLKKAVFVCYVDIYIGSKISHHQAD